MEVAQVVYFKLPLSRWPKIPGFYSFTQPCRLTSPVDMKILESWRAWFKSRDPEIATRTQEVSGYAVLYRANGVNGGRPVSFTDRKS